MAVPGLVMVRLPILKVPLPLPSSTMLAIAVAPEPVPPEMRTRGAPM